MFISLCSKDAKLTAFVVWAVLNIFFLVASIAL